MSNVTEYLANVRYMTNEMVSQLDNVHKLCSTDELDVETVILNLNDLFEQTNVILNELNELRDSLDSELEGESEDD